MTHLKMTEAGRQAYIMCGDQIKYEPAWVLSDATKKQLKEVKLDDALTSVTGKQIESKSRSGSSNLLHCVWNSWNKDRDIHIGEGCPQEDIEVTISLLDVLIEQGYSRDEERTDGPTTLQASKRELRPFQQHEREGVPPRSVRSHSKLTEAVADQLRSDVAHERDEQAEWYL